MNRIQLSENLYLDEYIPKRIYMLSSGAEVLQRLIHPDLIKADQLLRDKFGEVIINNWWNGGDRNFSGYRPQNCSIGADKSDHKRGMASDKLFKSANAEQVREYIKTNWRELGISKIEAGVSWVHTSVAYTGLNYLQIFNP